MRIKVTAQGASPLSLALAKEHLNIGSADTAFDSWITDNLPTALAVAEDYAQRSFSVKTIIGALDQFPSDARIALPFLPVASITSIKYLDATGVEQTLAGAVYFLDDFGIEHSAALNADKSWPDTKCALNAVKIEYVTSGVCPPQALSAMKLILSDLFENREHSSPQAVRPVPLNAEYLLDFVRRWYA